MLLLLVAVAFSPVLDAGFLNWDDPETVLRNPSFRGLGWEAVRYAFTTFHMGHYQPLSWLSLSLDHALWGLDPAGYHLTNLLLHAGSALLVYLLALRLFALAGDAGPAPTDRAARLGALVAAALFAVHPLRVESVAWVTERRDVLSGFFNLLTLLLYLRAAAPDVGRRGLYLTAAVGAYACGLLAKAAGVPVFALLFVLDLYPLRRLGGEHGWGTSAVWREKVPFAVLALAAAAVAPLAQRATGALVPWSEHGLTERSAVAVYGLGFYLYKTLLPRALSPLYELPSPVAPLAPPFLLSAAGLLLTVAAVVAACRRRPAWRGPLLAAAAAYLLLLAPVLGFFQSGPQLVADRYSYLPTVGLAVLAGAAFGRGWERTGSRRLRRELAALAAVAVLSLGVATWRYCRTWQSSLALWQEAVQVDPGCGFCREALANALMAAGRRGEAAAEYRAALSSRPHLRTSHLALGLLLEQEGRRREAIEHYARALAIAPEWTTARARLVEALVAEGRCDEARAVAGHGRGGLELTAARQRLIAECREDGS